MKNDVKRSLSLLLAAVLALTAVSAAFAGQIAESPDARTGETVRIRAAAASSGAKTENGLTYIVSDGQAVVIAADGSFGGEVVIPGTLGGVPVGVIGMGAFKGNGAITAVKLPDSVTVVDEQAFADCAALERIECGRSLETLPESAYAGCGKLNDLAFADANENFILDETTSVVYNRDKTELLFVAGGIGGAFTVPATVKYVRSGAFRNCTGLTKVVFAGSDTRIGAYAFAGCTELADVELPTRLSEISEGMFAGCTALSDVTIPGVLTAIGERAFEDCIHLPEFIVPLNCDRVGRAAFAGCASLVKVTFLAGNITALPDELFAGCAALKNLKLPEHLTAVGEKTFYNCAALENVGNVPAYKQFGRDAFTGTAWYAKQADGPCIAGDTLLFWKGVCDSVVDLSDKKIAAVAPGAFSGCETLTALTLPDSVASIGEAAFENCAALATVSYNGVAKIGARAFDGTAFLASAGGEALYLGANLIKAASAVAADAAPADVAPMDATPSDASPTDALSEGGKVYTVRQSAQTVAGGAFDGADPAIERIVLPEGILIVSDGAFDGLPALKTVNRPSTLTYYGWKPSSPACYHANTVVKYADAEKCVKENFSGCTYCADCAALLDTGKLRGAEGHRFACVGQEADLTLGEVMVIIECAVCKTQKRVPLSEYNVRFVDNDRAQADGNAYVVVAPGATTADVLKGCPEGTLVLSAAGERLSEDTAPGSGMRLLFPSSREYTVVLFGDADGDGSISPADARIALRRSVHLDEKPAWCDKACHVIFDGKNAVLPGDARMILRASVRLEDPAGLGRETKTTTATGTDAPKATETEPAPSSEPG